MKACRARSQRSIAASVWLLALLVGLAVSAAPRRAEASDTGGAIWFAFGATVSAVVFAPPGLVANVGIISSLARDGRVGQGWAVTGATFWAVNALLATPLLAFNLAAPQTLSNYTASLIVTGTYFAVSTGSLALSIYALMHPRPDDAAPRAPLDARRRARPVLALLPSVVAGSMSGGPGLTLTAAW